jgi:hypothetical protein
VTAIHTGFLCWPTDGPSVVESDRPIFLICSSPKELGSNALLDQVLPQVLEIKHCANAQPLAGSPASLKLRQQLRKSLIEGN